MGSSVKIVECPRDAWQGLPAMIPTELKASYLRRLVSAGFRHIDAVSFVSPTAVPQMADAEKVLELMDPPKDVEVIGIVVNQRGAERAIKTGAVRTLGFPYSISPQFLKRNQNQTQREALDTLQEIGAMARDAGMSLVAYVSMAFGNPYGDEWRISQVSEACDRLTDAGAQAISLADTVGLAEPGQVEDALGCIFSKPGAPEIGAHLHARPHGAAAKIRSAYLAGCRRFDSAIDGLGGCPFAQDALVGNLATETLIEELRNLGAELPRLEPLDELIDTNTEMAHSYGEVQRG